MNKARELHNLGQRLWLDSISREMLDNGTLRRYIDEFAITGSRRTPLFSTKQSARRGPMTKRSAPEPAQDKVAKRCSPSSHLRTCAVPRSEDA